MRARLVDRLDTVAWRSRRRLHFGRRRVQSIWWAAIDPLANRLWSLREQSRRRRALAEPRYGLRLSRVAAVGSPVLFAVVAAALAVNVVSDNPSRGDEVAETRLPSVRELERVVREAGSAAVGRELAAGRPSRAKPGRRAAPKPRAPERRRPSRRSRSQLPRRAGSAPAARGQSRARERVGSADPVLRFAEPLADGFQRPPASAPPTSQGQPAERTEPKKRGKPSEPRARDVEAVPPSRRG